MELEIPIAKQADVFKQHLDDERNERVIFSGIFGIGKSYFLNKYFEERKGEYITISLKPINYSISNNDDIFRLIKYDILYELIFIQNLELIVESASRSVAYGYALSEKLPSLIESFLPILPLLNKETPDVTPLLSFINKLIPSFKDIEETRKDTNLNQKLLDFVKEVEQTRVIESDYITTFIETALNSLASNNEEHKKLKVLVIDDLDRIDPEHIFRLFNIFSAHLDYQNTTSNKFGFDKVVFVCHIQNIRNIFAAKYGLNVDFSGYIDKFFSTEIFYFDNNEEVATATGKIIESIDFGDFKWFFEKHLLNTRELGVLNFLVHECINSGSLSIRRIKSIYGARFRFKERNLPIPSSDSIQNWHIPAIISLEVLAWIVSDMDSLDKAFQKLIRFGKSREQGFSNDLVTKERIAGYFIPFLGHREHKFNVTKNGENYILYKLSLPSGKIIEYELLKYGDRRDQFFGSIKSFNGERNTNPNSYIYEVIYEAFKMLTDTDYVRTN
ncbi:P-loop NTPase fold protein [Rufibacter radiotolerans]|uniref:P-loop NTPase fold protein n=1 Tax=Rufibacter radiotolerans TaxID=1379910 RepID=UPI00066454D5|nr:P-loop NTPase fold protein [Rufibacter radiotolerans]